MCRGEVAREEKRRLLGDTKYFWLKRSENLTGLRQSRESPASKRLLTARRRDDGGRAGGLLARDEGWADDELNRTISRIVHSNMPELKRAARSIRDERKGMLNWFSAKSSKGFFDGV